MSMTNVKTAWVDGDLYFYDKSGNAIFYVDGANRKFVLPTGSTFQLDSGATASLADEILAAADIALAEGSVFVGNAGGAASALSAKTDTAILIGNGTTIAAKTISGDAALANTGALTIGAKAVGTTKMAAAAGTILVGTKTSGDVTALDISAAGAIAIGQGAGETAVAHALSGDVTMTSGGVTAIGATKVTSAMLANGAGVAALLTAGLGGSASYLKTQDATAELVAANGAKDRATLVVAVVDESFADAGGNQPTFTVGEAGTLNKFFDTTAFTGKAAGTVLVAAGTNLATKNVSVTGVKAVGAGTGGVTVTAIGIPTT